MYSAGDTASVNTVCAVNITIALAHYPSPPTQAATTVPLRACTQTDHTRRGGMSLLAVGHLVIGYRVFHKIKFKFIKASYTRGVHKVPSPLPLTFKPIQKSIIVIFSELEISSNVVICEG